MMRSLWSAVSGLNAHQMEMDVIGNNIANVNTTSYKSQSTGFKDIMYQTLKSGGAGGQNLASTNAVQVGLGSKVGSIFTSISSQGSAVTTGNALDLMITGESFFVISPDIATQNLNFSRDGGFTVDANGFLVTRNDGYYVLGVNGDETIGNNLVNLKVIDRQPVDWNEDGTIADNEVLDYVPGEITSKAYLKGNIDKDDSYLSEGFNITLSVFGSDGNPYNIRFKISDAQDLDDSTYMLSVDKVLNQNGDTVSSGDEQNLLLTYDKHDGTLKTISVNGGEPVETTNYQLSFTQDASVIGPIDLDLSHTSNYASLLSGHNSAINAYAGDTQGQNKGYAKGVLTSLSFTNDGSIYGLYSNGQSVRKGQIAVAEFSNATGLEKVGDNLYAASLNSGAAMIMDITTNGGYMSSGALEGSNVDLSKEFTDMITTQRGFQANSRVITTSDEMLQILRGLKR